MGVTKARRLDQGVLLWDNEVRVLTINPSTSRQQLS